ncbi:MAG: phage tail protein [Acidobacteriota bacterium]
MAENSKWPDPLRASNFKLNMQGIEGHFVSCEGLGVEMEVLTFREGGQEVKYLPGSVSYSPVTLSYGVTSAAKELWQWMEAVMKDQDARKNVSVLVLQNDGSTEAMRWNLDGAWPCRLKIGPFNAEHSGVHIESLTLAYSRLTLK